MVPPQHLTLGDQDSLQATRHSGRRGDSLLRVVDGCLAGCIFVVPFLLGGQHPAGRLLLVSFAVVAAVAWTARQAVKHESRWRWSGVELILLAGVALLALQMTPLSQGMLDSLSPHSQKILPLWNAGDDSPARLGDWLTVSMTPAATRAAMGMFLAYGLLFVVAVQRIRSQEDLERLLRWIAISATVTATFGLVQYFTTNGKFFWFYQRPFAHTLKVPKAAFGNRNHFAHFLALGIGALVWWLQDGMRKRSRRDFDPFEIGSSAKERLTLGTTFRVVSLGIVLFALLLSLSRGGVIVAGLAAAISAAVCYRAKALSLRLVGGLGAVCLLIAASLAIFGMDRVSERLDGLRAASLDAVDTEQGRRTIWKATIDASKDYKLVGSGVGSFREVAPMYLESNDVDTYYLYAENGYLQIALEAGLVGLGLTLIGVACCGYWCLGSLWATQSKRTLSCTGAVAAGLAVSVVHSMGDFVWYNPACMTVAVILAACACRLWQFTKDETKRNPKHTKFSRPVAAFASLALAVGGAWLIYERTGPLLANEHMVRFQLLEQAASPRAQIDGHTALECDAEQSAEISIEAEERMRAELQLAVERYPDDARAHLDLAACNLRLFDRYQQTAVNVMSLGQIRDAAIQSRFHSRQALDQWLARAVGEHCSYLDAALAHTRHALRLCPLLGEGYLYLSNLCFLENAGTLTPTAYLAQAIRVRPFDGTVLFQAGKEAWLAGDYDRGLEYYRKAFGCGQVYQRQIIDWCAGSICPTDLAQEIAFFLEVFEPELPALAYLESRYHGLARPEETLALRAAYVRALEAEAKTCEGEEAAAMWLTAARLNGDLQRYDRAIACARTSLDCRSGDYNAHWSLANWLDRAGQYEEAEKELAWCLARQPSNQKLNAMYKRVVRMRIDNQVRAASWEHPTAPTR